MDPSQRNDKACFLQGERVEVLLPRPFNHGFDYRVPEAMRLHAGDYVQVPFGNREMIGVVWGEGCQDVPDSKCKSITHHFPHLPSMKPAMCELIDWVADYTLSPKGLVLKMAIPIPDAIAKPPTEMRYRLGNPESGKQTEARKAVLGCFDLKDTLSEFELLRDSGASKAVLQSMTKLGMLERFSEISVPSAPSYHPLPAPALRPEQQQAADAIKASIANGFSVSALEGVTGSGKTEVYFDAIEHLLKQTEGQILVLLPEIALTVQWMQRFERRFGPIAELWHSSVSQSKRKASWQRIASGAARLVVGARSALFLPYADLRLIVVDEEHEASYKQEDGVLYQARDMAVARASKEQIPVLLCSATPSIETMYNIQHGKYTHLQLVERHGAYHEPVPSLIDLREDKPERGAWLSPALKTAMLETAEAGHQSMLFMNRRGYAPLLLCRGCGHRFQCPNCSAWMVQHQRPSKLQCHHCDWQMPVPETCPECGSDELAACGPGVERIAEEVAAFMPNARLALLSSDEAQLAEQIESVIAGKTDVIIGTQMVAKGHHFPNLALVGVVDADIGLNGGDLRASERTYQLMHQLAGRAGREHVEGRVLLQTSQPDHPLMQALATGDREAFMSGEMAQREAGGWPPYGRLAAILLEGFDEPKVKETGLLLMKHAPRYQDIQYLGPAPAPMLRQRNRFRYRILVKAPKATNLQKLVSDWFDAVKRPSTVKVKVDIDPYQFM